MIERNRGIDSLAQLMSVDDKVVVGKVFLKRVAILSMITIIMTV